MTAHRFCHVLLIKSKSEILPELKVRGSIKVWLLGKEIIMFAIQSVYQNLSADMEWFKYASLSDKTKFSLSIPSPISKCVNTLTVSLKRNGGGKKIWVWKRIKQLSVFKCFNSHILCICTCCKFMILWLFLKQKS